jgi:hypothetical protein
MTILTKHVYDSTWSAEAQAQYSNILKQYPYIPPSTEYSVGLPLPEDLSPRVACQSAAEEAFYADYRPLSASFADEFVASEEMEEEGSPNVVFDYGSGRLQIPMRREQLVDVMRRLAGNDVDGIGEKIVETVELTSTKRKRYIKMKNHKRRKLYRLRCTVLT